MTEPRRAGTPWSREAWGTLHKPAHLKVGNPGDLCISREPWGKPLHKIIQVSMMPPVFFIMQEISADDISYVAGRQNIARPDQRRFL